MNEKLNIEKLFKSKLENLEITPSSSVWEKTSKKLRKDRFLRFNIGLKIITLISIIAISTISVLIIRENNSSNNQSYTINPGSEKTTDEINIEHNLPGADQNDSKTESSKQEIEAQSSQEKETEKLKVSVSTNDNASQKNQINVLNNSDQENQVDYTSIIPYFTLNQYSGCAPLEIELINHSINGQVVNIDFGDGMNLKSPTKKIIKHRYQEAGLYTIILSVEGENGEVKTFVEQVEVFPNAVAEFELEENKIINYSKNATDYRWMFNPNTEESLSNDIQPELTHILKERKAQKYLYLIASNQAGCSDTAVKSIEEYSRSDLIFPNAIQPSSFGSIGGHYNPNEPSNDVFYPVYTEKPLEYNLYIFNKDGEEIFHSNEIEIGWDGYYKETPAPQGVYIYKCSGLFTNGETFTYTGDLTILWRDN